MCLLAREALHVGKIAFHSNFFSVELGAQAAKKRLQDELTSFCVVTEAPKTTFGKVKRGSEQAFSCARLLSKRPRFEATFSSKGNLQTRQSRYTRR